MAQDPVIESLEIEPTHFRELNLSQEISDLASLSLIDPLNAIQSRRNAINLIENDTFDHLPSERELALRMKRNNTNNTKNGKSRKTQTPGRGIKRDRGEEHPEELRDARQALVVNIAGQR